MTIDIPTTRLIDGALQVLSIEEVSQEYYERMQIAYRNSINTIRNLANI